MPDQTNDATRFNQGELIRNLAAGGVDDPTIAARLGISVSNVRRIRREDGIQAGEQRWTGGAR